MLINLQESQKPVGNETPTGTLSRNESQVSILKSRVDESLSQRSLIPIRVKTKRVRLPNDNQDEHSVSRGMFK